MAEISRNVLTALVPYRELLSLLVSGAITADQLETRYIALYTDDPTNWPDEVFKALDPFFFDVDDYVADDDLRAEVGGIDANELRTKAAQTLARIESFGQLPAAGG